MHLLITVHKLTLHEKISTFEGISKPCRSIRDLSDGALFYDVLSEMYGACLSLSSGQLLLLTPTLQRQPMVLASPFY